MQLRKESLHFQSQEQVFKEDVSIKETQGEISSSVFSPGGSLFDQLALFMQNTTTHHADIHLCGLIHNVNVEKITSQASVLKSYISLWLVFLHVLEIVPNQSFLCETQKMMM